MLIVVEEGTLSTFTNNQYHNQRTFLTAENKHDEIPETEKASDNNF